MRYIFFFLFAILTFSSCEKKATKADVVYDSAITLAKVSTPSQSAPSEIVIPEKIIKQARLKFETNDLEATFDQINETITANKGNVQNDYQEKSNNQISRTLNIRVPSEKFDSFLEAISKGVSYFDEKNITSDNVTEQYIDLNSRLSTKRKLEKRYLEILQKATKISEILEIEKQISTIREEIEAKENQLKYLESHVSESTISIEFYKTIAQKENVKVSYGSKILTAIKTGFFSLSDFLISIVSVWPFLILFGAIVYFIRKRLKRRKKE